MNLLVLVFIGNPNLRKVKDEGLEIGSAHIQQILRNVVTDDIV